MFDDIDYAELFGVDDTGAEEQELADPAEDIEPGELSEAGAEEQEFADPADDEETDVPGDEDEDTALQTPEERSRYAAARRKAEKERDEAIAQAKADAQREIDEFLANSGIKNPFTGQPIRSKAEFEEYRAKFTEQEAEKFRKKSGMSDEEFNNFVNNLPEVAEARRAKEAASAAQREAAYAAARTKVDEQIREINKLDPTIKTVSDLAKTANYSRIYELVQKGNDILDAYKLANFDALTTRTAAASRQAALNAAAGKAHMGRTSSRGAGAVSVPTDIREAYLAFNPGASEAEIQKHYNKYIKK